MTGERGDSLVSFVISTYNRRDVLLGTLQRVLDCGLQRNDFEIIVVDNASSDGTADSVRRQFPAVHLIALKQNRGSCAKNLGIDIARGKYIVFLDDDSYPQPGSVPRMVAHFERDAQLGAAVFTVTLPDGSHECSAYPDVFIGCGTGFRAEALRAVGSLPGDFFMQAEEYDLSLRLLAGGWKIRAFADLHVNHLKTPNARQSDRTMRLDVRNNLIVALRYLPEEWRWRFASDWMWRYWRIARSRGQRMAFCRGLTQGLSNAAMQLRRQMIADDLFEQFARLSEIDRAMELAKRSMKLQRVLFIDYGKNILPYWLAAQRHGIEIVGIADERLAGTGNYRGIPLLHDAVARRLDFDAAIVSNSSPVHRASRCSAWRERLDDRPVLDLLDPTFPFTSRRVIKQTGLAA